MDKFSGRYRLYTALLIALVVYLLTKNHFHYAVCFMLTWIGFAAPLLIFSWITFLTAHPRAIALVAKEQDWSRTLIFLFVVSSAFISLFAIILLLSHLSTVSTRGITLHIILCIACVICSWTLIHTVFTLRYAHLFYSCKNKEDDPDKAHLGGLEFPGEPEPGFLDFAYFSFVLGMTFQVSDVQITSSTLRKLALAHGLLSFVYNTVIVALSINIISGLIPK